MVDNHRTILDSVTPLYLVWYATLDARTGAMATMETDSGSDSGSFRIKDYIGWANHVRDMKVPTSAALYVWTRELPEGSGKTLGINFNSWVGTNLRTDSAQVGPYSSIAIQTASPSLGPAKIAILESLPASPLFDWTREMATRWQRPLYVGITVNLRQRLCNHMAYRSLLRQYMADASLPIIDCRLTYFTPPYEAPAAPWEDESEEGLEVEQATPVPTSLVRSLRLTEALVIRLAQPYLNRKME